MSGLTEALSGERSFLAAVLHLAREPRGHSQLLKPPFQVFFTSRGCMEFYLVVGLPFLLDKCLDALSPVIKAVSTLKEGGDRISSEL